MFTGSLASGAFVDTTDLEDRSTPAPLRRFRELQVAKRHADTADVAQVGILDEMQNRGRRDTKRIAEDAANRLGSLKWTQMNGRSALFTRPR